MWLIGCCSATVKCTQCAVFAILKFQLYFASALFATAQCKCPQRTVLALSKFKPSLASAVKCTQCTVFALLKFHTSLASALFLHSQSSSRLWPVQCLLFALGMHCNYLLCKAFEIGHRLKILHWLASLQYGQCHCCPPISCIPFIAECTTATILQFWVWDGIYDSNTLQADTIIHSCDTMHIVNYALIRSVGRCIYMMIWGAK